MGAYRFGAKLVLLRPVYRGRREAPEFPGANTFPNSAGLPAVGGDVYRGTFVGQRDVPP